jgi:hypothetical protein
LLKKTILFAISFSQMQVWGGEEAKRAYDPIGEEIWDLAVDSEGLVYTARDRDVTVWILKGILF